VLFLFCVVAVARRKELDACSHGMTVMLGRLAAVSLRSASWLPQSATMDVPQETA